MKRVFISDDFDGELVRLMFILVLSFVDISTTFLGFDFCLTMFYDLFAVPEILELCEGCGGLGRSSS